MEGCRYPMPWWKDFRNTEIFRLYRTLAHTKAAHKALSHGGMKFLYAKDNVVAIARFWEQEVFVGILSTKDRDVTIRLPLGAVGAARPRGKSDVFGRELEYTVADENSIELTVKAHHAYFLECDMK